jgi:hypothetical protein
VKRLVNEVHEVKQYLEGKNIVLNNLYRICYLMVCYHKEKGLKKIEVRETLFEWGKVNHVFIKYNVNNIINRVFDSDTAIKLKSPSVKINKQDLMEIMKRFDDNKTKLVALAMLCYAKAHADKMGEFNISSVGLGAWLGINRKALRNKYIKELIEYEYLLEVSKPQNSVRWTQAYDAQSTRYKINAPLHNIGDYVLVDNGIEKLFSDIFYEVKHEEINCCL